MMDRSEPRMELERTSRTTGNRSAIVTGGASGIGLALAEELANAAVHVVLADMIIEPKWWRVFWYLDRLSPWLIEKFGETLLRRMRRELDAPRSE